MERKGAAETYSLVNTAHSLTIYPGLPDTVLGNDGDKDTVPTSERCKVTETQGSLQGMTQHTGAAWNSGHVFGQLVEAPHPNWGLETWRRLLSHPS